MLYILLLYVYSFCYIHKSAYFMLFSSYFTLFSFRVFWCFLYLCISFRNTRGLCLNFPENPAYFKDFQGPCRDREIMFSTQDRQAWKGYNTKCGCADHMLVECRYDSAHILHLFFLQILQRMKILRREWCPHVFSSVFNYPCQTNEGLGYFFLCNAGWNNINFKQLMGIAQGAYKTQHELQVICLLCESCDSVIHP